MADDKGLDLYGKNTLKKHGFVVLDKNGNSDPGATGKMKARNYDDERREKLDISLLPSARARASEAAHKKDKDDDAKETSVEKADAEPKRRSLYKGKDEED